MPKFTTDNSGIKKVIKIITEKIKSDIDNYKINNIKQTSVIFLAWAPWCWKTEFILSTLDVRKTFFFIDIDSYREYFWNYKGKNSKWFQKAVSFVLDWVLKFCFKNDIKFILDWTFKSKIHVIRNLDNCKRKHRKIEIFFIFQNPYVSYYYTFLREIDNERNIPIEWFIECFYNSIENIFYVKAKYESVKLFILEKNRDKNWNRDYKHIADVNNLTLFCNQYNIDYQNEKFLKKDFLLNWIISFKKVLNAVSPLIKTILFIKKKLWLKK